MEHEIPLVAEQLHTGKRTVETGRVHISTRVVESEQIVEMPLTRETVDIERVSVNRVVDHPSPTRQEGGVMIVPVYEEVLVVTKQLVLKEELRITRRSTVQASEPQRFCLRREEIDITRSPAAESD